MHILLARSPASPVTSVLFKYAIKYWYTKGGENKCKSNKHKNHEGLSKHTTITSVSAPSLTRWLSPECSHTAELCWGPKHQPWAGRNFVVKTRRRVSHSVNEWVPFLSATLRLHEFHPYQSAPNKAEPRQHFHIMKTKENNNEFMVPHEHAAEDWWRSCYSLNFYEFSTFRFSAVSIMQMKNGSFCCIWSIYGSNFWMHDVHHNTKLNWWESDLHLIYVGFAWNKMTWKTSLRCSEHLHHWPISFYDVRHYRHLHVWRSNPTRQNRPNSLSIS